MDTVAELMKMIREAVYTSGAIWGFDEDAMAAIEAKLQAALAPDDRALRLIDQWLGLGPDGVRIVKEGLARQDVDA